MSRISWIPAALFVVSVPLFLATAGVTWAFNNPGIYEGGFEKYDISFRTGITDADLAQVSADIRGYFNSRREPLDVRTRVFGRERELFNTQEIVHMRDVKRLVWGVYVVGAVTAVYMLAATGVGIFRQRRLFIETLAKRFLFGAGLTLAIIVAIGLFALVGFDTLFLKFHQLSFANDFWQLNSSTDFLVMLFPQDFWFDATMWVAARAVVGALILSVLSGGYLLYSHLWGPKRAAAPVAPLPVAPVDEAQEA